MFFFVFDFCPLRGLRGGGCQRFGYMSLIKASFFMTPSLRLHLFNEENVKIFRGEIRMNIASELPDSVVREMLKNYTIKYKIVLIS